MNKPAAPDYRAIEAALKLNRAFANRQAELEAVSDAQLIAARILFVEVERELQRAETFTPADRAWFRKPITTEEK